MSQGSGTDISTRPRLDVSTPRKRMTLLLPVLLAGAVGALLLGTSGNSGSTPPSLQPLWTGGFENNEFRGFVAAPWNFDGSGPPVAEAAPGRVGKSAARFTLGKGARRQELVAGYNEHDAVTFGEGDDRYFSFSTRFATDWPSVSTWQLVAQWKADGQGSPPIAMFAGAHGTSRVQLVGAGWPGAGGKEGHDLGPLVRGRWIDWVVHIKFSTRQERALVEVWRDGALVARQRGWRPSFGGERAGSQGATLRKGRTSYLKFGIYRDPSISAPARWWTSDWTISQPA
jgi:hypothetical protein